MRPGPLKGVSKSGREGHSTMGFDHTLIVFTIRTFYFWVVVFPSLPTRRCWRVNEHPDDLSTLAGRRNDFSTGKQHRH